MRYVCGVWNFRDLTAWQRSRVLAGTVFDLAAGFPARHRYGIATQLERAANSIGANIAEAAGRPSGRDRARFLSYAIASANETEHHVLVGMDAGLVPDQRGTRLIDEVDQIRRMCKALRRRALNEHRSA